MAWSKDCFMQPLCSINNVLRNIAGKPLCRCFPENFEKFQTCRNSPLEEFLRKGVLKIYSKVKGEHSCRSVISIKLLCNFIKITFRHMFSPVILLHIFRKSVPKDTSEGLLLDLMLRLPFYKHFLYKNSYFFIKILKIK